MTQAYILEWLVPVSGAVSEAEVTVGDQLAIVESP